MKRIFTIPTLLFLLSIIFFASAESTFSRVKSSILSENRLTTSLIIETLQDALAFDVQAANRTCEEYEYIQRRLKHFQEIVQNLTESIPAEEINTQISLLQEIKAMMQQLQITIPTYTEPLSLIQVRPSHLASSFSVLKLVSEYNAVNQENLIQFQAKLDSFFSENYSVDEKLELIAEIIELIDSLVADLKTVLSGSRYETWSSQLSASLHSVEEIYYETCVECDPSCFSCNKYSPSVCTACRDSQVLQEGKCYDCPKGCLSCSGVLDTECLSCVSGYNFDETTNRCCHDSCETCSGPSDTECLSCRADRRLSSSNRCCHVSCEECSGPNAEDCVSCESPLVLDAGLCVACHASCATCSGPADTQCLSCEGAKVLENSQCVACHPSCSACTGTGADQCSACANGFVLQAGLCVACDASCAECSGPSADECVDCTAPLVLSDNRCVACHESCLTCFGPSENQCLTCKDSFVISENSTCVACDEACDTCFGTGAKECLSCKQGLYFQGFQCLPCDSACASCTGPDATDCIKCSDYHYRGDDDVCHACDSTCLTCSGPEPTQCLSCERPLRLFESQGVCGSCDTSCSTCSGPSSSECLQCKDSYVNVGGYCLACDSSCESCSGTSATKCTHCFTGFYLEEGQCKACDSSCKKCSSGLDTDCTSCGDGFHIANGRCCDDSCVTCDGPTSSDCLSCADGLSLADGTCFLCDPFCATCKGPLPTDCLSCIFPFELNADGTCQEGGNSGSLTRCDPPKVLDKNGNCVQCDASCLTCQGAEPTDCLSCQSPLFLYEGSCVSCDSSCENCNGPAANQCTSCRFPLVLDQGSCVSCHENCATCHGPGSSDCDSCNSGTYLAGDSSCQPCDASCVTCTGPTAAECSSCSEDHKLSEGYCCHSDCYTCNGPNANQCLTCFDDLKVLSDGSCFYCHSSCETCSGPENNQCLTCKQPLFIYEGQCLGCHETCDTCNGPLETQCLTCPESRFFSNGKCETCASSCLDCSGPLESDCISCREPNATIYKGFCFVCDASCASCDGEGPQHCTSCESPLTLSSAGECVLCDSSCKTCDGSSERNCTSCEEPALLINGQCVVCDATCATCDAAGADHCISCDADHVLSEGRCCEPSCKTCTGSTYSDCSSCDDGYALVENQCQPCDVSCETCSGVSEVECLTCDPTKVLSEGRCCDKSCKACSGPSGDECTACGEGLVLSAGNCVVDIGPQCASPCVTCSADDKTVCLSCAEGYSLIGSTCVLCDSSCASCSGPNVGDCLQCSEAYNLINGFCCEPTCQSCNGPSNCTSCGPSFFLEKNGSCSPCYGACGECFGTGPSDCLSCASPNHILKDGVCCDEHCETCSVEDPTACYSCREGSILSEYTGECLDISPGNGKYVAYDDDVLNYNVTRDMNSNVSAQNDVAIGLWSRYLNYLPKTMVWSGRHVLFKLYTNSAGEKEAGVASFAAYFTSNSYIFETYTRDSNNKSVIISKNISVSSEKLENSWNFVSLRLNQKEKTMSVYVKFQNNDTVSVNLSTSLNQDAASELLAAYFCQENTGNSLGFNGQISSPVVLYGKNIAKNFLKIWDGYFPYPDSPQEYDNYTALINPSITEIDYESSVSQLFATEFSESRAYSTSGWFKYSQIYPKYTNNTQEHTLLQLDLNTADPFTRSSLSASLFPYNQTIKFQYLPVFSDPVLYYLSAPKNLSYINIENNWIFFYMSYNHDRHEVKFAGFTENSTMNYSFIKIINTTTCYTPFGINTIIGGGRGKRGFNGHVGAVYVSNLQENKTNIRDIMELFPNFDESNKTLQNSTLLSNLTETITLKTLYDVKVPSGSHEYSAYLWFKPLFDVFQREAVVLAMRWNDGNYSHDILTFRVIDSNKSIVITTYTIDSSGVSHDIIKPSKKFTKSLNQKSSYFYFGYSERNQSIYYYYNNGDDIIEDTIGFIGHYALPGDIYVTLLDTDLSLKPKLPQDQSVYYDSPTILVGPGAYITTGHATKAAWRTLGDDSSSVSYANSLIH